ncbi:MAG: transcription termination/antitermination protein NusG [Phycisphaerales bacterium]|nr:transcription termination/antitermination protein NusG [Phycisphaerales bacterium]
MSEENVKTHVPAPNTWWYVLRVISGKEKSVKEYLDKDILKNNWAGVVKQVFLPVEKVLVIQNNKRILREKNFYPGYILIEVNKKLSKDDDMVQHINNIQNIMHFLTDGSGFRGNNLISLRHEEVNRMLGRVDEMNSLENTKNEHNFIVGESIKIIDGPFNDFNGTIEEINIEKKRLKVVVKIFGRSTPVEVNYLQVERIT